MDIFDDDNSVDDDLCLANTEFQQNLKSIENVSFVQTSRIIEQI